MAQNGRLPPYQYPPPGWLLTGNAGTVDGTHFIGTTDNVPLNMRVNNQKAGRVGSDGPVFLGYQAGNTNIEFYANSGIGYQSLYSNDYGLDNTAFGYQSLYSNTYGNDNTANGYQSLYLNTTGFDNTATGSYSLNSNTEGSDNTATGVWALCSNSTGNNNTANGVFALSSNTTGSSNTAVGNQAGEAIISGSNNTFIGYDADVSAVNLNNATAIGSGATATADNQVRLWQSGCFLIVLLGCILSNHIELANLYVDENGQIMRSNGNAGSPDWLLTGNAGTVDGTHFVGTTDNVPFNIRVNNQKAGHVAPNGTVFLGYQAGNSNESPSNTGIGYQALYSNIWGNQNTANGMNALYSNSFGSKNTANGYEALYSNTTGEDNTAIGTYGTLLKFHWQSKHRLWKWYPHRKHYWHRQHRDRNDCIIWKYFRYHNVAVGDRSLQSNTEGYKKYFKRDHEPPI